MKATVAYEAARRQKPAVKQLKWHLGKDCLEAKGVKGEYVIKSQKPNRRLGIFKWGLFLKNAEYGLQSVGVDGKAISLDDRSELKAFASSYDAIPAGTVIEVNEAPGAAKETCSACGHAASESPTREEWEVIVTNPPATHRGAILAMGLGETSEVGNKIILRGFHDDEQAGRVASSIARTYKVQVTFGPCNVLYNAAEGKRRHVPQGPPPVIRDRVDIPWREYSDGTIYAQAGDKGYQVSPHRGADGYAIEGYDAMVLGPEPGAKFVIGTFKTDTEAVEVVERQIMYNLGLGTGGRIPGQGGHRPSPRSTFAEEAPRASHGYDRDAATELELYADNTSELYNQKTAIIENLKKKMAKGVYNSTKAQKLWSYWVDAAAKRYAKEFGGTWNEIFGVGTRLEVARREEEKESNEMQLQLRGANEGVRPLA